MSGEINKWWKTTGDDKPLRVYTPDPRRYHSPDSKEMHEMGGSSVGAAVMIPRANIDGTSMGFDPNRAGVFTIDPDKPNSGGGIAVDPAKFINANIESALSRVGRVGGGREDVESQQNAFAAFQILSQHGAGADPDMAVVVAEAEINAHNPTSRSGRRSNGRHVTPLQRRSPTASQISQPVDDLVQPQVKEASVMPTSSPRRQPLRKPAAPAKTDQTVQMSNAQAMAMLTSMFKHLQNGGVHAVDPASAPVEEVDEQPIEEQFAEEQPQDDLAEPLEPIYEEPEPEPVYEEPAPEPAPPPRRAADRPAPRQAPAPAQHMTGRHPVASSVQDTLSSLQVGFLKTTPQRPQIRVVFGLGAKGTMQTRYHDAIAGTGCLVLVYDCRYDGGDMYVPPAAPDEIISVRIVRPPAQEGGDTKVEQYTAASMGMAFNMGQLDFIVLVIPEDMQGESHQAEQSGGFEQPV